MQQFYPPAEVPVGMDDSDSDDEVGPSVGHRAKPRRKAHQRPQVRCTVSLRADARSVQPSLAEGCLAATSGARKHSAAAVADVRRR